MPFGMGLLGYVCGLLHDLGKYSPEFQRYLSRALKGEAVTRGEVPHAWEGALAILRQLGENPDTMGLADILANVVASHHGGLTDMIADSERVMPGRLQKHATSRPDNYREVMAHPEVANLLAEVDWVGVQREFAALSRRFGKNKFALHLAVKFLYSCLVDADRCDAAGLTREDETPAAWNDMERCLDARLETFSAIPPSEKSPLDGVRGSISDQCARQADRTPGILTLSVPTGGGKTLASLRFAIRHARKNGLKRIIYVIPYLSIIDQTAGELRKIFGARADEWLLEHHSDFLLDSDDEETEKRYDLGTQRWDAPVIVTTMVQFLESAFSNKASSLRKFHNMAKAVFVFDEVQALPVKCTHLFNGTLNFLSRFGGSTCVLCSATQPALAQTERPLRLSPDPGLVTLPETSQALFRRTRLVDMTSSELTCEEIAALAFSRYQKGESTLVVMNTKSEARKVFDALPRTTSKYFLSTAMCPAHRLDVIDGMRAELAPDNSEKRPVICVSTQLIEAGVDISFDCAIRALAGFDSIIQVAGRCNRHGLSPVPREVILVRVADEDKALERLPDIQLGKRITARLIDEKLLDNPTRALETFYAYKFGETKQRMLMDYPTSDKGPTLYDALGNNLLARQAYAGAHDDNVYPGLHSAFQYAAERFKVIEGFHIGVVVPYDSPRASPGVHKLVKDFLANGDRLQKEFTRDARNALYRERSRILRRLQQYTISVFAEQENAIRQIAAPVDDAFYFLSSAHYDPTVGLTATPGFLSL